MVVCGRLKRLVLNNLNGFNIFGKVMDEVRPHIIGGGAECAGRNCCSIAIQNLR